MEKLAISTFVVLVLLFALVYTKENFKAAEVKTKNETYILSVKGPWLSTLMLLMLIIIMCALSSVKLLFKQFKT